MPADCTISEIWTDSSPVWRTELHNLVKISQTYFCGEKEAEDMMEKAGLCQLAFAGVENILCGKEELLHKLASQQQEKWLNLAWRLSQDRKLLGMSEHFLYIGRKQ